LAFQAWREWQPIDVRVSTGQVYRRIGYGPLLDVFMRDMRSYKDPNPDDWSTSDGGGTLDARQARWFTDSLRLQRDVEGRRHRPAARHRRA
jgi:alkaline phosphatase D